MFIHRILRASLLITSLILFFSTTNTALGWTSGTSYEPYRPPDAFASPTPTTTSTGYCGDGICQNPPEQCDDGSLNNGPPPKSCSTSCTLNSGSSSTSTSTTSY